MINLAEFPWGFGKPRWHLEYSTMSEKNLELPFDIHGGGLDLIFPHHENEIAQTCGAYGVHNDPQFLLNTGFIMDFLILMVRKCLNHLVIFYMYMI